MTEIEQKAFEQIEAVVGKNNEDISSRTIEETVSNFLSLAPEENSEQYWTNIGTYLSKTVTGNIKHRAKTVAEKKELEFQAKLAEEEKKWKEKMVSNPTPNPTPTPTPVPNPNPNPTPTDGDADLKKLLESLNQKIENQDKLLKEIKEKEEQEKLAKQVAQRRDNILGLAKAKDSGMDNEFIRDIVFENYDFGQEKTDTEHFALVKERYTNYLKKYQETNPAAPVFSVGQSKVGTEDFLEAMKKKAIESDEKSKRLLERGVTPKKRV